MTQHPEPLDEPTEELPGVPFTRSERTLSWLLANIQARAPSRAATPADELSELRRLPDPEALALAAALGIDEPDPTKVRRVVRERTT